MALIGLLLDSTGLDLPELTSVALSGVTAFSYTSPSPATGDLKLPGLLGWVPLYRLGSFLECAGPGARSHLSCGWFRCEPLEAALHPPPQPLAVQAKSPLGSHGTLGQLVMPPLPQFGT